MDPTEPTCPPIEVVIAIVQRGGKILICQRHDDAEHLPGYWEFPGGKREPDESIEECLLRELLEELDIHATLFRALTPIEHTYPTRRVRLIPLLCELERGDPKPLECQRLEWIAPTDLRNYQFPPANEPLIAEIINALCRP